MKRAGNLLSAFFERNRIHDTQGYVDFFQSWQEIVGVDLAAHSDAVDIRNRALVVEVDHPGWMQRLHMQRERILKEIQRRYPTLGVENLHFTLVEEGKKTGTEQRSAGSSRVTLKHTESGELSEDERERLRAEAPQPSKNEREALEKIGSKQLRDRLESLSRYIHERDEDADNQD